MDYNIIKINVYLHLSLLIQFQTHMQSFETIRQLLNFYKTPPGGQGVSPNLLGFNISFFGDYKLPVKFQNSN